MSVTGVLLAVTCLGVLAAALGVAAATDLSCRIVPNGCAIAVAAAGALRAAVASAHHHDVMPLLSATGGGLVVLVVMLAAAGLSARAGHGPGVGGGDVKLLSAVGFPEDPAIHDNDSIRRNQYIITAEFRRISMSCPPPS